MTLMATLLALFTLSSAITFEQTSPVVWMPVNKFVDAGEVQYDLTATFLNPCSALLESGSDFNHQRARGIRPVRSYRVKRQNFGGANNIPPTANQIQNRPHPPQLPQQISGLQLGSVQPSAPNNVFNQKTIAQQTILQAWNPTKNEVERKVNDYIIAECNNIWDQLFLRKLTDWTARMPIYAYAGENPARVKRDLTDAIETAGGVICGTCITNLILGIFNRWYPNSDHNKIARIEEPLAEHNSLITSFKREFNLTQEIHKGMAQTLAMLGKQQIEQHYQIQQIISVLPRVSWSSSYIQSKITTASADLQSIIDKYMHGNQVATKELARMFNIEVLRDVPESDTKFISSHRINEDTINMKFVVRERSRDTSVYMVGALNYWDNLIAMPALKEYRGHK